MATQQERGDTIIEVMFAVAVFAMVAVGSLMIMNQGVSTAQRSLEVTLVRQQVQAEADAIRFIHDAYITNYQQGGSTLSGVAAEWPKMTVTHAETAASDFSAVSGTVCPSKVPGASPFIVNPRTAKVESTVPQMSPPSASTLPPFSQILYRSTDPSSSDYTVIDQAYGIWVEAVPSAVQPGQSTRFVDFHIRACWDGIGIHQDMTIGTIVRLYEPVN